ncbi:DUF2637 domain-containing protein [Streptomyces sp. NPDC001709]
MPQLTGPIRWIAAAVVTGVTIIAGIGFYGSYHAVKALAVTEGFGTFAYVFPVGIDAGIVVLLALDLLLTWIRIPFPLLRHVAWLLTMATIAFNGAAAWPDPLGVGMHAVIPVLFVVAVEASRHAIGRIADITADKHMEGVRVARWLLSPFPTFRLWRKMQMWEVRSYEQIIKLEQERLVYQALLRSRFGRAWRRKAPVESVMPLRLARHGVPLAQTAPAGLAAAGIDPTSWTGRATYPGEPVRTPAVEAPADADPSGLDRHADTAIGITAPRPADRPAALPAATPPPARHAHPGPEDLPWPTLRTGARRATTHPATHPDPAQPNAQDEPSEAAQQGAQPSAQEAAEEPAQRAQDEQPPGEQDARNGEQEEGEQPAPNPADKSTDQQDTPRKPPSHRKPRTTKTERPKQTRAARNEASTTAQRAARRTGAQQEQFDAQIYAARNEDPQPSFRTLAARFNVSDGTVRNAIDRHAERLAEQKRAQLRAVSD